MLCYMLDESICHFRGVGSFLSLLLFMMETPASKHCRPDLTPHDVASDLGLHCLPMTLLPVSR